MNEPNLAVIENRLTNLEDVVHDIADLSRSQGVINSNLQNTVALLQQSQAAFIQHHEREVCPKVQTLWENRSAIKGGYMVVAALGGIIVGGVGVAAFLYEAMNHVPK